MPSAAEQARPRPVILLHGTNDTAATLGLLAARLAREQALNPVALDYGRHAASLRGMLRKGGIASLATSFEEIREAIDHVLLEHQAVDIVGHSQGGLHALAFARLRPDSVSQVVMLGSPITGVVPLGTATPVLHRRPFSAVLDNVLGPSARAQLRGSAALPDEDVLAPNVRYLLVVSALDRTVRERDLRLLPSDRLQVRRTQELTEERVSHAGLVRSPAVLELVVSELIGNHGGSSLGA